MAHGYSAIPTPTTDINSLLQTVQALKINVELLTRQRGTAHSWAAVVEELAASGTTIVNVGGSAGLPTPAALEYVRGNALGLQFETRSPAEVTGDITFAQSGTGAQTRTVLAKLQEVQLSLTDYGTFQQAIDALPAAGGTIVVPPGDHTINADTVCTNKNLLLDGSGIGVGRLMFTGAAAFRFVDNQNDATQNKYLGVRNLSFVTDTTSHVAIAASWRPLRLVTRRYFDLDHVEFTVANFATGQRWAKGISLTNSMAASIAHVHHCNSHDQTAGTGIELAGMCIHTAITEYQAMNGGDCVIVGQLECVALFTTGAPGLDFLSVVTGQTSGATARWMEQWTSPNYVVVSMLSGTFAVGETINDGNGHTAVVQGIGKAVFGCEGVDFLHSKVVNWDIGFKNIPGASDMQAGYTFLIDDTHFNCRTKNVQITGAQNVSLTAVSLHANSGSGQTFVELDRCEDVSLIGNSYIPTVSGVTGLSLARTVQATVMGERFRACDTGMLLAATLYNSVVKGNAFWNSASADVNNSATAWPNIPASVNRSAINTISSIAAAGSGYVVGDVLTLIGGWTTPLGGNTVGRIRVTTVNGSGGITAAVVQNGGTYLEKPSNAVALYGGTGTGATVNLTWTDTADGLITGVVLRGNGSQVFNPDLYPTNDPNYFMTLGGGNPQIIFNSGNDYLVWDRTNNNLIIADNNQIIASFAIGAVRLFNKDVTFGANDSGGIGFKLLRVPN